jgi:hypothetical protein
LPFCRNAYFCSGWLSWQLCGSEGAWNWTGSPHLSQAVTRSVSPISAMNRKPKLRIDRVPQYRVLQAAQSPLIRRKPDYFIE